MAWIAGLRPASFAGLGFYVRPMKAEGGRRLITQEIPNAAAYLEDQGALPAKFTVTAYFLGESWLSQRENFLKQLDHGDNTQARTLVLPTKGPLKVRLATYSYQDDETIGAYGEIEISFVVDAGVASPLAAADTASSLLDTLQTVAASIQTAYETAMGPIEQAAAIASYQLSLLGGAVSAVLALPGSIIAGVDTAFTGALGDAAATASLVTGAFLSVSDNAVAVLNPPVVTPDPISGAVPVPALPADPSLGLAALTAWGNAGTGTALTPPPAVPASLGVMQAAVQALVQQSAGLAMAALFAQTSFSTAQAAAAARAQLSVAIAAIGGAIVDAGNVDMFRAWCALGTLAQNDMIARAQNLPQQANYDSVISLPDVVLAQRLLQDGAQGPAIFALNAAIHPLFMPPAGVWLEAA